MMGREWVTNDTPVLSVVIATVEPWPAIQSCLDSLLGQARTMGAEMIVVDGHGGALPEGPSFSDIVWLREIGSSIFRLRALAFARARGGIVAVTEDHCTVAPDWCRRIVDLHCKYPDAMAIGGAVENGATGSVLDWIHFLIANGPFMRPVPSGESRTLSGQANVSFKRKVLPPAPPDGGLIQFLFNRELQDQGLKFVMDDGLVVWHIQSLGFAGSCRMHFHNGRSIAGFRLLQLSTSARLARLASCLLLPAFLMARTALAGFRKKRNRLTLLMGLPILAILVTCHTAGEMIGYLKGAGNSPQRVR